MAKQQMDFTLSREQVAAIVTANVLNAMIDCTRFDAKVVVDSRGAALVTVTRKRARKAKAPKVAAVKAAA